MNASVTKVAEPKAGPKSDHTTPKDGNGFASHLLAFEAQVRSLGREAELVAHLCNDGRRILNARQAFFLSRKVENGPFQVIGVSSIPIVDRNAPTIRWIEKLVKRLGEEAAIDRQHCFTLPAFCDDTDQEQHTYPFAEFVWTPMVDGDRVVAGYLTTRETPFPQNELALAERISSLYETSLRALSGRAKRTKKPALTKKRTALIGLALLAGALFPVPISALAPVTVRPLDPFIVAAPFEAVVREIVVDQGSPIADGDLLIKFDDIEQRNAAEIAQRRNAVSQAKLQRVSQAAIYDQDMKKELAVAKAEYALANAELAYAEEVLTNTSLTAPKSGLAIYSDKRDWVGQPVNAGQAILYIANPDEITFAIDLPVKESIVLKKGAEVKVFLDSAPLNPIRAVLTETSYEPRADDNGVLSYRLRARFDADAEGVPPRIGVKGTAQIMGDRTPFIYAVLRRPLSSLRQLTGI